MSYAFGVDIGATRTTLAVMDLREHRILAHQRVMSDYLFTGHRAPSAVLYEAVTRFMAEQDLELDKIVGVGVGVPGVVDRAEGAVLTCPNLHVLDGVPLAADTAARLGVPVYLDNNTNLICLGEYVCGAGRGVRDMAVVFVGSGLGSGLILDGKLYEGADGAAAEFGHTIIVANGLPCTCGAHGCLEMYCSGKALSAVAEKVFDARERFMLGSRFGGARLLIEQASFGHDGANRALEEAFTYLGLGLTSLVNLLNPRLIVLGGGIVFNWPRGVDVAREVVMREALPQVREKLRIEISELRDLAGVSGGAVLVALQGRLELIGQQEALAELWPCE
ncbi:MAG: ROK family protein [Chloroflexi bacterium]|nr:ROK family protein [Chloroflexota bacterium]